MFRLPKNQMILSSIMEEVLKRSKGIPYAAEGLDAADDAADRARDLDVGIIGVEAVERPGQAAVERRALPADLVALHGLRLERRDSCRFPDRCGRRRRW